MSAPSSSLRQRRSGMLKSLGLSLILSITLSGCLGSGGNSRVQFLTPTFTPSELTCPGEPQGQLPADATAQQVADRIVDIDESGETCRQKLDHVKTKVDVYKEVADQINSGKKPKKP